MNVVLLHAFPLDERMWEPQRPALANHEVTAPNLYALGSSMDAWAEKVLASVDGPLVAVGASMGGYCALAMAARAPERVVGLVLVGSRTGADPPDRKAGRAVTAELVRSGGPQALWDDMRPKLFHDDSPPAAVEQARAIALEQSVDPLVAGIEAIRDRADTTAVVERLDAPLLVVHGEHDPFLTVAEAGEIASAAVNGQLCVFDGCGHLPSLERPGDFNAALTAFLARWS